jgi:hypothetical protein
MRPGAVIRVREVIRSVDVLSLETEAGPASLGLAVAARIRVRPR